MRITGFSILKVLEAVRASILIIFPFSLSKERLLKIKQYKFQTCPWKSSFIENPPVDRNFDNAHPVSRSKRNRNLFLFSDSSHPERKRRKIFKVKSGALNAHSPSLPSPAQSISYLMTTLPETLENASGTTLSRKTLLMLISISLGAIKTFSLFNAKS